VGKAEYPGSCQSIVNPAFMQLKLKKVWRLVRSSFRILFNKGIYNFDWQLLKMGVSDD
jgi:uncharacterized protein (UPF0303 family)